MNRLRRPLLFALGLLMLPAAGVTTLAAVGGGTAHAQTPTAAQGCWVRYPGQADSTWRVITAVSAAAPDSIWAIGSGALGNHGFPLTEAWDAKTQHWLDVPNPGGSAALYGVKSFSPHDAWAVGEGSANPTVAGTVLAWHWDGVAWTSVTLPDMGPNSALNAVSGSAPDDVWAAGYGRTDQNIEHLFILHWNGIAWAVAGVPADATPVGTPIPSSPAGRLSGITSISRTDAWAVGFSGDMSRTAAPLALHWDGNAWLRSPLPSIAGNASLNSITAIAENDIWAVGQQGMQLWRPLIVHWDGSRWKETPVQQAGSSAFSTIPVAVAGTAGDDVWAFGYTTVSKPAGSVQQAVVFHWDGHDWREQPSPVTTDQTEILGATAVGGRIWAVGLAASDQRTGSEETSLFLQHENAPCAVLTPVAGSTPGQPLSPPVPVPGTGSQTFPQTGKTVSGVFLDYWKGHGGLMQQGYPISDLIGEVSPLNGMTYTVQYFERAEFEYHPENKAPYNVLLSQLGLFQYKQKYKDGAPNQQPNNSAGSVLFPETGRRVGDRFLQYWKATGGLMQQGLPISDEFTEVSPLNGKSYTVQYFERAAFELHPENVAPYDVLLSLLGRFRYDSQYVTVAPVPR